MESFLDLRGSSCASALDKKHDDEEGADNEGVDPALRRDLRERRELFVDTAIATAISEGRTTEHGIVTATVGEERKAVTKMC
ncbi:hypothetical protein QCA50_012303 [Cerrena zonata]|uniref:Uncharacterized protein n=1 Tax=Cerrena zonata TaxID=2478898 RepID=A0AAW0FTS2_9APHY